MVGSFFFTSWIFSHNTHMKKSSLRFFHSFSVRVCLHILLSWRWIEEEKKRQTSLVHMHDIEREKEREKECMHARTHLFHQFKYLSGELNPILLLAFFPFLFYVVRSFIYSTNEHSSAKRTTIHVYGGNAFTKRRRRRKKTHESSSIFDNSVIVHIKGDAIILHDFLLF